MASKSLTASVFIIDPHNKTRLTLTYPKSVGRNFNEILRVVDALQLTDFAPIATPADWQPGERVIVSLGLHSVVFGVAEVAWLDIGPQGVSKATMLQRLCDRLGIDRANTLAIGDSMNDIAMLEWAGRGVLMGHAVPEMHVHADVLTSERPGYGVADALNAIGS